MAELSPKFPLLISSVGSYESNTTIKQVVKQNFKNLLLTSPGERIMDPQFGVGIRRFLFEQVTDSVINILTNRVQQQVSRYMPYINIQQFSPSYEENQLIINIAYFIIPLSTTDILSISAR